MENKKKIAIALGVTCFALTLGIAIQLNTVNSISTALSQNYELNTLRTDVLRAKEKYENMYRDLEEEEEKLDAVRQDSIKNNGDLESVESQIQEGEKILGLTEVEGAGIEIILDDSELSPEEVLDPNSLLVHDFYLLYIVNELKNAGAEAISINDQRITTTTGIVCGGNIVEINGQKVGAPFTIKAIGLPEQLAAIDRPGGYLDALRAITLEVEFEKKDSVTIPKYTGVMKTENLTIIN